MEKLIEKTLKKAEMAYRLRNASEYGRGSWDTYRDVLADLFSETSNTKVQKFLNAHL